MYNRQTCTYKYIARSRGEEGGKREGEKERKEKRGLEGEGEREPAIIQRVILID